MKILILASNWRIVSPDCSTAPERIASILADNLVKRGNEVTLAASGNSVTEAKLFSVTQKSSFEDENIGRGGHVDYEFTLIKEAIEYANSNQFDIIHSQFDTRSAILSSCAKMPVIATLHSPITDKTRPLLEKYKKDQSYISISNSQRNGAPDLNYFATIYHGIDLDKFTFGQGLGGYYLSIGRLIPDKGFHLAIEAANKASVKLHIIGRPHPDFGDYLEKEIRSHVGEDLSLREDVPFGEVPDEYSGAKAMLFPLQWEEPFGLTMIEAMACGTPVIAFNRGSVKEVVKDGVTGFVVEDLDQMVDKIKEIESMPTAKLEEMRKNCREHVEENFTIAKMVDGYEAVYKKVIEDFRNNS